ncbi:hypothetical protein F2Q70_00025437 [Brassica cretica]|uniref:Uncharacterized protein n=1 Tax=Brassica cretica TaxID=69181 RepID=A0A8S9IGG1_BRACR|nr:hypothetical protein F2Q68_00024836 [Brassica cretica]KAF2604188.1 hypothetical protein F2Q70_00025437 [Brassica cretica]
MRSSGSSYNLILGVEWADQVLLFFPLCVSVAFLLCSEETLAAGDAGVMALAAEDACVMALTAGDAASTLKQRLTDGWKEKVWCLPSVPVMSETGEGVSPEGKLDFTVKDTIAFLIAERERETERQRG